MAYSNYWLKGRIGFQGPWPIIVMERAKSDKPETPVLCEVWGHAHECGSVYARDLYLTDDADEWVAAVEQYGGTPEKRYFKGALTTASGINVEARQS